MRFSKNILSGGARVVLIPMLGSQTVLVQVMAGAGSHYESKKMNGISHFLEHILFKGTVKRPSSQMIAEEIDKVGGELNAFTDKEMTGYWARVAKDHWALALDVISDLYLHPLLKQKEIDKERGVILQEAAMYRDMPAALVWDVFEEMLFGDQPAGRNIVGLEKNIQGFQREDFVDYLKNHYGEANTVITIAGNFEEEEVFSAVKNIFQSKNFLGREKRIVKMAPVKKNYPKERVVFFSKKTDQAQFVLGAPAADMFDEKRLVEKILAIALGGGMSSRLFLNIREKRGLCYHISAGTEQNFSSGYFHISAGVDPQNLPIAIQLVLKELTKMKTKKIAKSELRKVKDYFKGKILMGLETPVGAAGFFANQELFKGKIESEEVLLEKIEQISAQEILEAAERIFTARNLRLATVTENNQKQEMEKILKKFA